MRAFILFFFLFAISSSFSQVKLRAYLDNKQFYAPEIGNYIEFHMQFIGYTFDYIGVEGGLQTELAIALDIKKGEELVYSDAYRLQSPVMLDSIVDDFYDIKRVPLEPGNYSFVLRIDDLINDQAPLSTSHMFAIEDMSDGISISDIEIAELAFQGDPASPFFKSGLEIIPRLSTFYPEQLNKLPVYFELYNTTLLPDSVFGIKQEIINADTGDTLSDLTSYSRHKTAEVVPIFKTVDLEQVFTGKYILKYCLIDRTMRELAFQTYEFERSYEPENDLLLANLTIDPAFQESITDDSVFYFLESLIPILGQSSNGNFSKIFDDKDKELARLYIQSFWTKASPVNPYEAWIQYKHQVQYVQRIYGNNFQEGFETDRGRVYLQYGAPTTIVTREYSPTEYPYEIWQYNKIGRFSNKRFIFYNPDLVNKAYRLIHSDMIGEIKNPAWPRELAKRNTTDGNIEDPNGGVIDHWGGNSNDLFRQY